MRHEKSARTTTCVFLCRQQNYEPEINNPRFKVTDLTINKRVLLQKLATSYMIHIDSAAILLAHYDIDLNRVDLQPYRRNVGRRSGFSIQIERKPSMIS